SHCSQLNGCNYYWWWTGNCELGVNAFCGTGGVSIKTDQSLGLRGQIVQINGNTTATVYSALLPEGAQVRLAPLGGGIYRSTDGSGIRFDSNSPGTLKTRDSVS